MSGLLRHAEVKVVVAFWLFGLINNVLYVIILSAAQDLVGTLPKGVVLLADVMPSFFAKLFAPYFIHRIPYPVRVVGFIGLSVTGMLLIALTPPSESSVSIKMMGVVLASLSSGFGELSFLGLTHFYGRKSLAGWGSGTGAAGLVGAGLYVVMTEWWALSVRASLLFSACLPVVMMVSFFGILPLEPLRQASSGRKGYEPIEGEDGGEHESPEQGDEPSSSSLLSAEAGPTRPPVAGSESISYNLRRVRALFFPYMLPLFLVYVAEYTINQGVAPTLLFPLGTTPFKQYRAFYPVYSLLYQIGVFISRSSISVLRINNLYMPSLLQVVNLVILVLQALLFYLPSVWVVFLIIFWEGLLGGAVYVNSFAGILENVKETDREFSLGAATVSDSAGICVAGFLGILLEPRLCEWQVDRGRAWCSLIKPKGG